MRLHTCVKMIDINNARGRHGRTAGAYPHNAAGCQSLCCDQATLQVQKEANKGERDAQALRERQGSVDQSRKRRKPILGYGPTSKERARMIRDESWMLSFLWLLLLSQTSRPFSVLPSPLTPRSKAAEKVGRDIVVGIRLSRPENTTPWLRLSLFLLAHRTKIFGLY